MRTTSALVLAFLLSACSSQKPVETVSTVQCTEPRPQVCTMEYAPVCATGVDGTSKHYASGCNACADDTVIEYLPGSCAE